jgi:hypothetical protein
LKSLLFYPQRGDFAREAGAAAMEAESSGLIGFEKSARQAGLPDDRLESPGSQLWMIGNWNRDRRSIRSPLHHDVTASSADFRETLARENPAGFPAGNHAQLTQP